MVLYYREFKSLKRKGEYFRNQIFIRHKIGITAIEIFKELQLAIPEKFQSYVAV